MAEKEPQVTFTDRRKISSDGEIRPEAAAEQRQAEQQEAQQREAATRAASAPSGSKASTPGESTASSSPSLQGSANVSSKTSGKVTSFPSPSGTGGAARKASAGADEQDETMPPGPTAQETEESHAAYRETTQQLDDILRAKAPDSQRLGPVGFEHLVQSMYMTAMMALGAGTQPGEKPRIDLMGARQTIDLLSVLGEKTKGNLNEGEQRLLDSALFELRMMFLEITNAIARNAAKPGQQDPQAPKRN